MLEAGAATFQNGNSRMTEGLLIEDLVCSHIMDQHIYFEDHKKYSGFLSSAKKTFL